LYYGTYFLDLRGCKVTLKLPELESVEPDEPVSISSLLPKASSLALSLSLALFLALSLLPPTWPPPPHLVSNFWPPSPLPPSPSLSSPSPSPHPPSCLFSPSLSPLLGRLPLPRKLGVELQKGRLKERGGKRRKTPKEGGGGGGQNSRER
jgi:hypothetical protein